jgi:hypothetical protein
MLMGEFLQKVVFRQNMPRYEVLGTSSAIVLACISLFSWIVELSWENVSDLTLRGVGSIPSVAVAVGT